MLNRRDFLLSTAALSGLLAACQSESAPESATDTVPGAMNTKHIERVGLGLFTIPKLLDDDFEGTMAMLAQIGYKELEFFGPYPFSVPEAHARWTEIAGMLNLSGSGYFGLTGQQVRAIMDQNGLTSPSMHIDLGTLRMRVEQAAEAAQIMGQHYMGISAIPESERPDLDGYKRIADEFNAIATKAAPYGVKLLYHNHGYGLTEMEGEIPFQVVLERTDPDLVAMEMDIYWTTAGHADPVDYLKSYSGRFKLLHVKDMREAVRFKGDGSTADQWIELQSYMIDAGSGVLDLETILGTALESGAEHFYVEQDLVPNPDEALRNIYNYISSLGFS
jgi:sugar phosphate isomerase/epimerase